MEGIAKMRVGDTLETSKMSEKKSETYRENIGKKVGKTTRKKIGKQVGKNPEKIGN